MVKALLFDLIDTLIELPQKPRNLVYRLLNLEDPSDVESLSDLVCSKHPVVTIDDFISKLVKESPANYSRDLDLRVKTLWLDTLNQARLSPYADMVLKHFRKEGYKLAVVSNTNPPTRLIIHKYQLDTIFNTIAFSCDVGSRKPNKEIYYFALKALGIDPSDACMVGNKWGTDILGAMKLNMYAVLLGEKDTIPNLWQNNPYLISCINNLADLPKVISRHSVLTARENLSATNLQEKSP